MSFSKKSVSRRAFLRTASLGAGAIALAACAAPAAAPAAPAATAAAPAAGEPTAAPAAAGDVAGELTFWGHADHPVDNAGRAFAKANPGVTWTFVELGDDRVQKVDVALAAGSGAPDLFWYEASDIQRLGRTGALLDVDELVKQYEKDLVPAKLAEAKVNGKYFGMPGDITPNTLWVRPDLLEAAGVPALADDVKYEDFLAAAKTVKEKTDASMFVFDSTGTGQSSLMFMQPFYSLGGNFTNETGEEVIFDQGDAAVKSLEHAKAAWDSKAGLDAGWFSAPYWGAIGEGKLAGAYSPPWMRGFFEAQLKGPEQGIGKWKSVLLPIYAGGEKVRSNVFGGATLASFNQTKVPDLVKTFMGFTFASMEGAQITGDWGIVPPYVPWLNTKLKDIKQTLFADATWADTLNASLAQLRTDFYRTPGYGLGSGGAIWDKYFMPMMKGEMVIADGVKGWADDLRTENKKLLDSLK